MSFLAATRPMQPQAPTGEAIAAQWRNAAAGSRAPSKVLASRGGSMKGIGASPPPYGTKAWWVWYGTTYLPQKYNQQQALTILQNHPLFNVYGIQNQGQSAAQSYYPYGSGNYSYWGYNYPYYGYQNQYQAPYTNYQRYIPYGGIDQGVIACNQQGGTYDAFNMTCSAVTGQPPYGNTVTGYPANLPNVTGVAKWSAVAQLNGAGYTVWLLNEDGIPQGTPPGYDARRVNITVANGVVTGASIG